MWDKIWQFLNTHTQHATFETILMILAIIAGAALLIIAIIFIIKSGNKLRKIKKEIEKGKISSNKKILLLLKQKKNKSY